MVEPEVSRDLGRCQPGDNILHAREIGNSKSRVLCSLSNLHFGESHEVSKGFEQFAINFIIFYHDV